MASSMTESGLEQRDGGMESKSGLMEPNMKDNGPTTRPVAREHLPTFMEMFTKETGKTIRHLGSGYILTRRPTPNTRAIGKTICSMGLEFKYMLMEIDMKACFMKARDMGKESIFSPMAPSTVENG